MGRRAEESPDRKRLARDPLPSIFVSQDQHGRWELVDGLQRVSTLLQTQACCLTSTVHRDGTAPSRDRVSTRLDGYSWDGSSGLALSPAQQLDIRLARLDLKVIKRGSDEQAKYDLFQRLNSFGAPLTVQEIRSALIAGKSSSCLSWLNQLAQYDAFLTCTQLADRLRDEQYDLESCCAFLFLHDSIPRYARSSAISPSAYALERGARARSDSLERLRGDLQGTFDWLAALGSEKVLRKWIAAPSRIPRRLR